MQDKRSYIEIVKDGVSAVHLPTEEADLTKSIYVHNYAGNIKHEKVSCCISIRNLSLFTLNVDANN